MSSTTTTTGTAGTSESSKDDVKDIASQVGSILTGVLVAVLICLLISFAGNVMAYRKERKEKEPGRIRHLYLAGSITAALLTVVVIVGLIAVPMVTSRLKDVVDAINRLADGMRMTWQAIQREKEQKIKTVASH